MSLKGIYLFIIFLFAAQATKWTYSFGVKEPVQFLLIALSSYLVVYKYKISFQSKRFKYLLGVLFAWFISHCVFRGIPFEITALINLLFFCIICYIVVNVFKKDLLLWIEDIILKMTYISILLYLIMLIVGGGVMASIGFIEPSFSATSSASLLIFNIPNFENYDGIGLFGLPRNCGFCWEPGRFACFVCVGITLNLLRTNMQIKGNKSLFLLLVGLFTSFSTTGYFTCMMIFLSFFASGQSKIKSIILLIIAIPICLIIIDLPFMREKIEKTSADENFVTENVENLTWIDEGDVVVTPQRFECISLDWLNFMDSPIIGYGMNNTYSWVYKKVSDRLALSNGLIKDFAQFGFVLALIYNFLLFRNSFWIASLYNSRNRYGIILLYYTISVSYPFIMNTILTPLFLYSFFINNQTNNSNETFKDINNYNKLQQS